MNEMSASGSSGGSTWWRWIVLLPACVLGSALASFAMGLFQWFGMRFAGGYTEDGWFYLYILPIITSATLGYAWVKISCEVAPKAKKVSAIVTTAILLIVVALTVVYSLTNPTYTTGQRVQSVLGGIAIAIAAIVTILEFQE